MRNWIALICLFLMLPVLACEITGESDVSSKGSASRVTDFRWNDDDDSTDDDNPGLTQDDFQLIADGGIDDRLNSYPWAVELFDGDGDGQKEIYVGTIANALCLQVPMASFLFELFPAMLPPDSWGCDLTNWNPDNWLGFYFDNLAPALVFRGRPGPEGFSWKRVFQPTLRQAGGFRGAAVFDDRLFMLGATRKGAYVWGTSDGVNWEKASEAGVIEQDAGYNTFLRGAVKFKGRLYVASSAPTSSLIYASDDPAPGNWEAVNSNGFVNSGGAFGEKVYETGSVTGASSRSLQDTDASWTPFIYAGNVYSLRIILGTGAGQVRLIADNTGQTLFLDTPWDTLPDSSSRYEIFIPDAPDNGPIYQLAVFADRLYAAPLNYTTGGELWYSEDPAIGNWKQVISRGFGMPNSEGFMTLQPFGDYLYLGTVVYPGYFSDIEDMMGTQVIRIDADNQVEVLVGSAREVEGVAYAPLSGIGGGFDYLPNLYTWDMTVHDGRLYLGTFDAGGLGLDYVNELFPEGLSEDALVVLESFLGPDRNRWGGFDFYRTQNGVDWEPVSLDGFGNGNNYGIRSLKSTPWGLLLGAANPYDGFELWLGNNK